MLGSLGTAICLYVTYMKYFGGQWADRQWTLQLGILLVFIGVQLLTMGLLAEMLARTYHESQGKPIYVIREIRQSEPGELEGDDDTRVSLERFI